MSAREMGKIKISEMLAQDVQSDSLIPHVTDGANRKITFETLKTAIIQGLASEQWVGDQGFLTSSALAGYATQNWVDSKGFLVANDLNGYATQNWVNAQGFALASSLSGYVPYSGANQSVNLGANNLSLQSLLMNNGRILSSGTAATTSDLFNHSFSGTWTPTGTVGNQSFFRINPTLNASVNSQTLNAVEINPTFSVGAFTGCQLNALRVVGPFSETLLGTNTSSWANSFSASNVSVRTVVGAIATVNTTIFGAYMYSNSNNATQVGLSMYRAGSSAPTTGFGWAIQSRINDDNNANVNWSWAQVQWETATNLSTTSRTIFTNMDSGVVTQFLRAIGGNTLFGSTATVPSARVHIIGNSTLSGNALQVDNAGPTILFRVQNAGIVNFGNSGAAFVPSLNGFQLGNGADNYIGALSGNANGITLSAETTTSGGYSLRVIRNGMQTITTGAHQALVLEINGGFNPTSGNASLNMIHLGGGINQTGTASGTVRSIFINHALTNAVDYRGLEIITGNSNTHTLLKLNNGSQDLFCVRGDGKAGFFGKMTGQAVMPAVSAGSTYTATEQKMLNDVYTAVRDFGIGN